MNKRLIQDITLDSQITVELPEGISANDDCTRYREAIRGLADTIEDKSVFLDALGTAALQSLVWSRQMTSSVKERLVEMTRIMNEVMPAEKKQLHWGLLEEALQSSRASDIDYSLNELLYHSPGVGAIKPLFQEAIDNGVIERGDAERILSKYRFKFLGSIETPNGCVPMDLHFCSDSGTLYVSDRHASRIDRYSSEGEKLGTWNPGLCNPEGIFSTSDNSLWVCDAGNSRVLRLGENGVIAAEIDFQKIQKEYGAEVYPRYGCACGETVYVTLVNKTTKQSLLVSFLPDDASSLSRVKCLERISPLRIYPFRENIALYWWPEGEGETLNVETGILTPAKRAFRSSYVRGMVHVGEYVYLLSGSKILKISNDGVPIFAYELADATGAASFTPLSMTLRVIDGQQTLFVSDGVSGNIFLFGV